MLINSESAVYVTGSSFNAIEGSKMNLCDLIRHFSTASNRWFGELQAAVECCLNFEVLIYSPI